MSARDDYPPIPNGVNVPGGWGGLHLRMCDEIDRLRAIKKSDDGAYEHVVEMYHAARKDCDTWEATVARLQAMCDEREESVVQERHLGQLMYFAQQRWQSMAEDLWEELQEWHDQADCPTFNGGTECTCHRILAENWAQLTNADDWADDGVGA